VLGAATNLNDELSVLRVHVYGSCADAQIMLDEFSGGHAYPCWYDPDEPGEAVLVRGYQDLWWLLIPWPFILIGGLGLTWLFINRRTRHQSVRAVNPME
jgi:hypothetical protein